MKTEEQEKNFQQVKAFFEIQRQVREGEIEGTCDPSFDQDAQTIMAYGLITWEQCDKLRDILR